MIHVHSTITLGGLRDQLLPAAIPNDATLVAAAQADSQAFAPLYARYLQPIYRYCYRRLGTCVMAEDATSEVFVKALAGLPRYRGAPFAPGSSLSRATSPWTRSAVGRKS